MKCPCCVEYLLTLTQCTVILSTSEQPLHELDLCLYAADMQLLQHSELSGLMKEQLLFKKEVSFVV